MATDAFISHASEDFEFTEFIEKALKAGKLSAWVDRSDVKFGVLLRNQIQSAIRDSRILLLVWSKNAFASRWVMSEIFTAFYLERLIVPCVLDETPLPQFLANSAYVDRQRDKDRLAEEVCRAVRTARSDANEFAPVMISETDLVRCLIKGIAAAQKGVMEGLKKDFHRAAGANRNVDESLESLQNLAPLHPMVLNLAGYQCKNNYIIAHWDAIRAGRAPNDQLLIRGERFFFESLCVNPRDESAINGLGSILFYERELDAAEFLQRRAIDFYLRRTGKIYEAAQHDLDMVLGLKQQQDFSGQE
jgi:hypothetical protein